LTRIGFFLILSFLLGHAHQVVGQTPASVPFDVLITGGTVYDGTGSAPVRADVALRADHIVAIGNLSSASAHIVINAQGLAVAPGFINMLSHSERSLIVDGCSQGEIRQGVTTQIFGEFSMAPLSDEMKQQHIEALGNVINSMPWTNVGDYLTFLEKRGISQNVASFVGAGTIREYVIGLESSPPSATQPNQMKELVRREMKAGALGVTTMLIYPPDFYSKTNELIALCKVASEYRGKYVREEKIISLAEAIRRLTGLPATTLELEQRGFLKQGYFGDIVVFDAQTIGDRATYANPHQYAVGMKHVFVNGRQVLKHGEHTGAKPGRALWGPGKVK
jgi:N-acyl-D-amino-acid deacylase